MTYAQRMAHTLQHRGARRALTVTIVLALAGCGGGKPLTEGQLSAALLQVSDLPTGYSLDTTPEAANAATTGTSGTSDECTKKFKALQGDEKTQAASADITFNAGLGIVLKQGLESYDEEDKIDTRLAAVTDVLEDCPTFISTAKDGVETAFTVGVLSFPKLGDQTVALTITGKAPTFAISLNLVVVKLGRNILTVGQGGLSTDAAALEQAVRKGVDKLAAAAD